MNIWCPFIFVEKYAFYCSKIGLKNHRKTNSFNFQVFINNISYFLPFFLALFAFYEVYLGGPRPDLKGPTGLGPSKYRAARPGLPDLEWSIFDHPLLGENKKVLKIHAAS